MNALRTIAAEGTSIWLDDLSRARLSSNSASSLSQLILSHCVVGVTTNPSIFQQAISKSDLYLPEINQRKGSSAEEVIHALTSADVRDACDLLMPIYLSSQGKDGRVSIEVDPRLAHETEKTIAQAHQLWESVKRPNLMIKVPATLAGIPAITSLIASGISVNVTLIFSAERYGQVLEAFLSGLRTRADEGLALGEVHSVASFFISRVDSAVDPILEEIGTSEAEALLGVAAIANAKVAYGIFEESLKSDLWQSLAKLGANPQRPLWASTGVKNARYDKSRYVVELVAPHTVNTMPEATLLAVQDSGKPRGNTISETIERAHADLAELASIGVNLPVILQELERDGVAKFEDAWNELISVVAAQL